MKNFFFKSWWDKYKNHVRRVVLPGHLNDSKDIAYWRNETFLNILIFLAPLSIIALVPSIYMSFLNGLPIVGISDIIVFSLVLLVMLNRGLTISLRKSIFIFIIFTLSVILVYYLSMPGPGIMFLLAVTIFSSIIYSPAAGYYSAWANTIVCICFALLIYFKIDIPVTGKYNVGTWIAVSSNLVFVSFVCAISLNMLLNGLENTIDEKIVAEKEIKSQANLLNIVEQAVISTNLKGIITYWNKGAENIYGWKSEETIGKNAALITPGEQSANEALKIMKHLASGHSWSGEFIVKAKDGTLFPVAVTNSPIHDKNGKLTGIIGVSSDISARKNQEQKLREAKANLRAIIENTDANIYSLDTDFRYIIFNQVLKKSVKKSLNIDIKPGDNVFDFFEQSEPEEAIFWKDIYTKALTGRSIRFEKNFNVGGHLSTTAFAVNPIVENKKVIGLSCFATDITDRKKAEEAIQKSEEKYRYLFNNNPALIIIWDIENFRILDANDVVFELYGYTREEFLNMTILQFRPDEDVENIKDFAKTARMSQVFNTKKTWRHLKKNGEMMYMDISSHKIEYQGSKAILSLAKDITEKIIAENQLKETYDNIRRLNAHLHTIREEERTFIAREIHDELGQQLTVLKMDVSWLTRKVDANEKAQHEKLAGMITLIDDTVKSIRRISTDLRPAILDDMGLVAALEWQSTEFQKRTGIQNNFQSQVVEVNLDANIASGIFRIYQETLTNIMRHAKAISVNTTLKQTNDWLILSIQDYGEGFDLAEVKSKKTLGLTGIRERVLMFGGKLIIESEKGKGTTVVLQIPLDTYNSKISK